MKSKVIIIMLEYFNDFLSIIQTLLFVIMMTITEMSRMKPKADSSCRYLALVFHLSNEYTILSHVDLIQG